MVNVLNVAVVLRDEVFDRPYREKWEYFDISNPVF
jgi:hypothetical protein